ncbi:hypothetical protein BFP70_08330 [Thioclava sp. SK-1]|uniref:DUF6691 family protein n=1 Tax=Thioclava sp. SK-1 TaxID=1889770 RepID=UPI000824FD74|nr:DUF6691 family protein [Thioclava sp. SK-1]OCX66106.1 hypothetical protein BFP70_08330 [Thioclava sp. SK-1]
MRYIVALAAGALFGLGLLISGMTDTARVQGFLDVAGAWDPTLVFVLVGAMVPMALAWQIRARRMRPVIGAAFPAPANGAVNRRLIGGSVLFGIGWGLAGFCPGPAIAALGFVGWRGAVFVATMIIGMWVVGKWFPQRGSAPLPR